MAERPDYPDKPFAYLCGCRVIETKSVTGQHRAKCPDHGKPPDWETYYDRDDTPPAPHEIVDE